MNKYAAESVWEIGDRIQNGKGKFDISYTLVDS